MVEVVVVAEATEDFEAMTMVPLLRLILQLVVGVVVVVVPWCFDCSMMTLSCVLASFYLFRYFQNTLQFLEQTNVKISIF